MRIGNVKLKNNLILAPMAGITDVGFRTLCVRCGADYGVTEMVSAKAMAYNNQKTFELLHTMPDEHIKVVQIFGSEPDIMAQACKSDALKKFDIIDINMGCPAPKIYNNGEGSALLKNIELAESIIRACVSATDKPITVKFRLGVDDNHIVGVQFAQMCERAGAKAITVHGRTTKQMYSGQVNLEVIKQIKQSVNIPVIANGDVVDVQSYKHILEYTHCDAVMIGRGSFGNPAIFSELLGKSCNLTKLDFIKQHIKILQQFYPNEFIVKHMRKHILYYLKGVKNANNIKVKICMLDSLDEVLAELEKVL